MKYTLPKSGDSRTSDYIGTVEVLDDASLANLKSSISIHNRGVRRNSRRLGRIVGELHRVRIKPRGPRASSSYHTLMAEATHYDIYAGVDTNAMYWLKEEMSTGMTPGELAQVQKLRTDIWRIELDGLRRKRNRDG